MIDYQVISSRGKPRFAVVEYSEFMRMLEQLKKEPQPRERKTPVENDSTARKLTRLMRINPIRGWRLFRNLTQSQLAEMTGLKQTHVSLLEARKIEPRRTTLNKLATALMCKPEDLVPRG